MKSGVKLFLQCLAVLLIGYIIGALYEENNKSVIEQGYEDGRILPGETHQQAFDRIIGKAQ